MRQKEQWKLAGAVLGAITGLIGFCIYQNKALVVTPMTVTAGLAQPLKIVQLSDLHGAQFGRKNSRLLQKVLACEPDLIVFTGDLVNYRGQHLDEMVDLLDSLNALAPVCAVPGNHEHCCGKFWEIAGKLRAKGIHFLINETVTLFIKGQQVNLLGLDENQNSRGAYHALKKGRNLYIDNCQLLTELQSKSGLKLVLSHFPENFALTDERAYRYYNFDLMLAGHAHGGQFRLPKIGGLYAPGQGLNPPYDGGIYGERPWLIVSRGLGNSTFPQRLFNRPEIIDLTIV